MIRQYIFFKRTQKIGCFVIQEENKSWICQVQVSCGCASLWFPQVWYKHFIDINLAKDLCFTRHGTIYLFNKLYQTYKQNISSDAWMDKTFCVVFQPTLFHIIAAEGHYKMLCFKMESLSFKKTRVIQLWWSKCHVKGDM